MMKSILSGLMTGQKENAGQQMPQMPQMNNFNTPQMPPFMLQMQQPPQMDMYGQQMGGLKAALMGRMQNGFR